MDIPTRYVSKEEFAEMTLVDVKLNTTCESNEYFKFRNGQLGTYLGDLLTVLEVGERMPSKTSNFVPENKLPNNYRKLLAKKRIRLTRKFDNEGCEWIVGAERIKGKKPDMTLNTPIQVTH